MKFGLFVAAILMVISCTKKLEPGATTDAGGGGTPNAAIPSTPSTPGQIYESPIGGTVPGPHKTIEEFKANRRKMVQEAIDLEYKTTEEQLKDPKFKSQDILLQKRAQKAKEAQEYIEKLREKQQ